MTKRATYHASRITHLEGQTLVEAIAALGLAVLIITALLGLGVSALRSAGASRNRDVAVSMGSEGLEAVRSVRDRNWNDLPSAGGPYRLVWTGSQWSWSAGKESISIFERYFNVTDVSSNMKYIVMRIDWVDSVGNHTFELSTYLADW